MAEKSFTPEAPESAYYIGRLQTMATELDVPVEHLSERGLALTADLLGVMHEAHGDRSSETYKAYHNDQHELDVIRRSWKLWGLMQSILPEPDGEAGYELLMIGGAGHDLFESELESARYTEQRMFEAGYDAAAATRVYDAIIATTVDRSGNGTIVQTHIRKGAKDRLKLALASADINGMAMEGIPAMVGNSVDLFLEFNELSVKQFLKDPTKIISFLHEQSSFIDDRLASMDKDVDYYFPGAQKQLMQEAFEREFTGATRDAIGAAKMLLRFPMLVDLAVRTSVTKAEEVAAHSSERLALVKRNLIELLHRN